MTSTIGVAKAIIANRPVASDAPQAPSLQAPSQATLGFLPLSPPRDSPDKQLQNERELIRLASSAGVGELFCIFVESINLT